MRLDEPYLFIRGPGGSKTRNKHKKADFIVTFTFTVPLSPYSQATVKRTTRREPQTLKTKENQGNGREPQTLKTKENQGKPTKTKENQQKPRKTKRTTRVPGPEEGSTSASGATVQGHLQDDQEQLLHHFQKDFTRF